MFALPESITNTTKRRATSSGFDVNDGPATGPGDIDDVGDVGGDLDNETTILAQYVTRELDALNQISNTGGAAGGGGASTASGLSKAVSKSSFYDKLNVGVLVSDTLLTFLLDAEELVTTALNKQLDAALREQPSPNVAMDTDAAVRRTFYTVLTDAQQRSVFVKFASNMRAWPRLLPLFGAPPYGFLNTGDAYMLHAAGIASSRTKMTYDSNQICPSYSQFGKGHFVDEFQREYRALLPLQDVQQGVNKETTLLPWRITERGDRQVVMHVRVKKRSLKVKRELLRRKETRSVVSFPHINEVVQLQMTQGLRQIHGFSNNSQDIALNPLSVKITGVVPRGHNASTALLRAVLL